MRRLRARWRAPGARWSSGGGGGGLQRGKKNELSFPGFFGVQCLEKKNEVSLRVRELWECFGMFFWKPSIGVLWRSGLQLP